MKRYKKMIIFPVLLAVTFLLLEIPKYIFQNKDEALSKESGGSVYEMQTIKYIDTFEEKINAFREFNELSTIGNTRELDYKEVKENLGAFQTELNLMTNGKLQMIDEQTDNEELEMWGVEIQILHQSDKSQERFVWEIGYLEFQNIESDKNFIFLYDPDSYKIFQVEWFVGGESESDLEQTLDEMTVLDYYGEEDPKEVTIFEESGCGLISVLAEDAVYGNELIMQIYDIMNYYRGVVEIESWGEE